ncbi:uncharacterized protein LOC118439197 [Folsomia candida]|uniref:uncharacterized protein LOC118439197 n=1 Tax=Folsomia candida TaxID=158441 RepID=UPI001605347F|nr:uncharacterized protein LOC118439197 [Folsomia candida]
MPSGKLLLVFKLSTILGWLIIADLHPVKALLDIEIREDDELLCTTDAHCDIEGIVCDSTKQELCTYSDPDTSYCACLEAQCYSNNECRERNMTCPTHTGPDCFICLPKPLALEPFIFFEFCLRGSRYEVPRGISYATLIEATPLWGCGHR